MSPRIAVYQLRTKFVNQRADVPENARQVVYYALAVGHHVGVLDCFSSIVEIPLDEYNNWLDSLPDNPGRAKLAGVVKWGEIEINRSHVSILQPVLEAGEPGERPWIPILLRCLQGMVQEPALYLMLRKHA